MPANPFTKVFYNFFAPLCAMMLFLTACAPTQAQVAAQTSTAQTAVAASWTPVPTNASAFTQAAVPTSTKRPSATRTPYPSRTPTPIPEVIWSSGLPRPLISKNLLGFWSPVANTIAGSKRKVGLTTGTLMMAHAPDFSFQVLDQDNADQVTPEITWSPDGKMIFYGITGQPANVDTPFDLTGRMQKFDIALEQTTFTDLTFFRGLSFEGWLDDETVVVSSYSGGGHNSIAAWNYQTKKVLLSDILPTYSLGKFRYPYVVVNGCEINCIVYVMLPLQEQQPKPQPCIQECRSKHFPYDKIASVDAIAVAAFSQDWLPSSNQLLVAVRDYGDRDAPKTGLILWDVKTGALTNIIGGGVYGQYSPDGNWLAWAGYEKQRNNPYSPGKATLEPVDMESQIYLQIVDIGNKKTLLSLPVFSLFFEDASIDNFVEPFFSFSPKDRWITLVTPGEVQVNANGWQIPEADQTRKKFFYSVIDLKNRIVQKTVSIQGEIEYNQYRTIWSPDGDRIIYQDEHDNWQLMDVTSGILTPITTKNGDLIGAPSWSYDGRYIQFVSEPKFGWASGTTYSVILDLGME